MLDVKQTSKQTTYIGYVFGMCILIRHFLVDVGHLSIPVGPIESLEWK